MVGEIIGFLLVVLFGFLLISPWIFNLENTDKKMEATMEAKIKLEETMKLYKLQQNEEFKRIKASLHKELEKMELSLVTKIEENLKSYKDQQNQDFHRNEEDERISEVIKEKLQSVDKSIEKIQNQVDGIHEQMKTWKYGIVQGMDSRLTEADGRLSLLFTELSDIYTYIVGFLLAAVIGIVFAAYKLLTNN